MGDYYKYKKILVILMIISCGFSIIKNIFKNSVSAAEIVNPKETNGNITIQYDNTWQTLRDWTKDAQSKYCTLLLKQLDNDYYHDKVVQTINTIYDYMMGTNPNRLLFFEDMSTTGSYNSFIVRVYPITAFSDSSNIFQTGLTINNSYNFANVPFIQFHRDNSNPNIIVDVNGQTVSIISDGNRVASPIPCLGCYSPLWLQVFDRAGIVKSAADYTSVLQSIETTNEENYTANYYTQQAVENTYSYLQSDNVDTITSSGITQPEVSQPDLSDTFDTLTDLLTNENYHSKNFTLTLPNNDKFNFSIDPDFLKTSLTRVGGTSLVTIIQTLWYIGLYGIMIFLSLKIIGSLLAGDLDSVVGSLSPVNSVVNSSLEVTGAFRLGDNYEGSFRVRR